MIIRVIKNYRKFSSSFEIVVLKRDINKFVLHSLTFIFPFFSLKIVSISLTKYTCLLDILFPSKVNLTLFSAMPCLQEQEFIKRSFINILVCIVINVQRFWKLLRSKGSAVIGANSKIFTSPNNGVSFATLSTGNTWSEQVTIEIVRVFQKSNLYYCAAEHMIKSTWPLDIADIQETPIELICLTYKNCRKGSYY